MAFATKLPSLCYHGKFIWNNPRNSRWKRCLSKVERLCYVELPGEWGKDEMETIWILLGFLSWLLVGHTNVLQMWRMAPEAGCFWIQITFSLVVLNMILCVRYTGTKFKDRKITVWKICISPPFPGWLLSPLQNQSLPLVSCVVLQNVVPCMCICIKD